jgi:hypothetical protein
LAVDDASAGTVFMCPACQNKFRVPAASTGSTPTPEPPASSRGSGRRSSAGGATASARDSARGSGRGVKSAPAPAANGQALDQLEVIDDDLGQRPRRGQRQGPDGTPQWVYITAGVAGVALGGLVVGAFFSSVVTVLLIVVGLPTSLLSRKWPVLGRVGIAYLLAGAGILLLSRTTGLFQRPEGPPPHNASARGVDAHCTALLKDKSKVEAGAWVSVERPGESSLIRSLRQLIADAYKAGATKVWLTNLQKVDPSGLPSPDMVVVLPDDDMNKSRVVSWYVNSTVGKQAPAPGDKYLYVPWD